MLENILRVVSFCCLLSDYLWGLLNKSFFFIPPLNLEWSRPKREKKKKKQFNWVWNIFKFKDERVLFTENSFKESSECFYLGNFFPSLEQLCASKAHMEGFVSLVTLYSGKEKLVSRWLVTIGQVHQQCRWVFKGWGTKAHGNTSKREHFWSGKGHTQNHYQKPLENEQMEYVLFNRGQLRLQTKDVLYILEQ